MAFSRAKTYNQIWHEVRVRFENPVLPRGQEFSVTNHNLNVTNLRWFNKSLANLLEWLQCGLAHQLPPSPPS